MERYDLVVIGAGPGGYVAAIRAAQLGLKTVVVEKDRPGGVCLNWGCIPSKALLTSAELYENLKESERHGIKVNGLSFDYAQVIKRSREVADRLAKGVEFLLKKNRVPLIAGTGRLESKNSVEYEDAAVFAKELEINDCVEDLLDMARVEVEHEEFFREVVKNHRLLPVMKRLFGWG